MRRVAFGLLALFAVYGIAEARGRHPSSLTEAAPICDAVHYTNINGHCVRRPLHAAARPPGASAQCRDGSYSFSEHHRGTCSHHGGVAIWY